MIAVAMSGGVDSSVTAALIKEQYPDVRGVFMLLRQPNLREQVERVTGIAEALEIPLHLVDLASDFENKVLRYFRTSYHQGRTPNPCAICNREIKFGMLIKEARNLGADRMATGHYARIDHRKEGSRLLRGRDPRKDQSYFLARLTAAQLAVCSFPLGEKLKSEVYELARYYGLGELHSPESQDICFLGNTSVREYLSRAGVSGTRGNIVTIDGRVIGTHHGIHNFTVGQRRGINLPDATPWYVVRLEAGRNEVVIGKDVDLLRGRLVVSDLNWLSGEAPGVPFSCGVQIRYRHTPATAAVRLLGEDVLEVVFEQSQRAVTPGQVAVFYKGEEVLGSGIIA